MVNDFVLMLAVALDKRRKNYWLAKNMKFFNRADRQTKLRQTKYELSFIRVWFYAINIHNSSIDLFVVLTHGEKS